jgi:hypothetical protein
MPEMASEEKERIISKVRKMMDRAKDPNAPEGEVEASLNMVRKFMEQFNLEDAEVFSSPEKERQAYDNLVNATAMDRPRGGFFDSDKKIAHAVTYVCGVKHYFKTSMGEWDDKKREFKYREALIFYGFPRDVAVATALYHELWASWTAMARYKCGKGWGAKHNAYGAGFSDRVWSRAYAMKRETEAAAAGSVEASAGAIVLSKEPMLRRYAEEKLGLVFPQTMTAEELKKFHEDVKAGRIKFRKVRPKKDYSSTSEYDKGYADGEHVSLGTNQMPGKGQGRIE